MRLQNKLNSELFIFYPWLKIRPLLSCLLLLCTLVTLPVASSPNNENKSEATNNANKNDVADKVADNQLKSTHKSSPPKKAQTQKPKKPKTGLPAAYSGKLPSLSRLNIRDAKLDKVLTGLKAPWAFEFINAQEVIITEISGKLSRFNLATEELSYISGLPEIVTTKEQTGLLDVELHPNFSQNKRLYFSYTSSDETGDFFRTVVATAILNKNSLSAVRDITPPGLFGWSPSNFGGALEFDSEGYLYITIGDRSEGVLAQQGNRIEGKLLRLHDDGSIPEDNPFIDDDQIDDRIYSLGLRNPQGLHFDDESGFLFETEHGPMGGDEVNIMKSGANYGWPIVGYGSDYLTLEKTGETHKPGISQPIFYYLPSIGISPLTIYRGDMFPQWEGDILVGALGGWHISRLDLEGTAIISEYPILHMEIKGRIRDIKVAEDGSIFILCQNGTLYRLHRDPSLKQNIDPLDDDFYYRWVCAGCHDTGINNAPVLGNNEDWKEIIQQPLELVYKRVIDGYKSMPERGLCNRCSDKELNATVNYMLKQVE